MSTPLVVQVFNSVTNAKTNSSMEALVHQTLSEIAAAAQASTPSVDPKTLITCIGDYLTQTAIAFSHLADKLVIGPHVEEAAVKAHEQARLKNHVSELAPLLLMDEESKRLRKIRDLTEKFSRDVQEIWLPVPPASPDSSVQQKALSSCDVDPTPLRMFSVATNEFKSNGSGYLSSSFVPRRDVSRHLSPCKKRKAADEMGSVSRSPRLDYDWNKNVTSEECEAALYVSHRPPCPGDFRTGSAPIISTKSLVFTKLLLAVIMRALTGQKLTDESSKEEQS